MTFLVLQEDVRMRKLFEGLVWRLELMGRSRAAAELMRQGYHEEAKRLILGDK